MYYTVCPLNFLTGVFLYLLVGEVVGTKNEIEVKEF